MKEQEIYKRILMKMRDKSEKSQINNTEEFIKQLIYELEHYELTKING